MMTSFYHPTEKNLHYSHCPSLDHVPQAAAVNPLPPLQTLGVQARLVGQQDPVWVERVGARVPQEVCQARHVDIRKPGQATEKVGWVVVCAKQAAKLWVEQ